MEMGVLKVGIQMEPPKEFAKRSSLGSTSTSTEVLVIVSMAIKIHEKVSFSFPHKCFA